MIYGFDTDDQHAATAALLVYAIYRSRNKQRYKVTPDMWGQIERLTKSAAKRAESLPAFIEALKPRLYCETISPRWMAAGIKGDISMLASGDELIAFNNEDQREFLTRVLETSDHRSALGRLYRETAWVILLVRDRLEREKPIEQNVDLEDA